MSKSSNKYHFVVTTAKNKEEFTKNSQVSVFLDKFGLSKTSTVFFNNKEGLTKIYNKFINETYKDKIVIFVHDDVFIEDLFIFEKMDIAFEKYDVVGLAGTKKCDLTKPPAWHLMSSKEDFIGEVAHSHEQKVWTTCFGPTDSRALLLDGLFLAVNVKRLLETGTKFDERFDFHHYDITFCLNANKNKLKLGVYPIRVVHFGLGDSMNTQEWTNSAELFKKEYIK